MTYSRRLFKKTAGLATVGIVFATQTSFASNSIWTSNSNTQDNPSLLTKL